MPFDLETLKEKLDSETLAELSSHIADLAGSRDAAKKESIDGRKALKEKVESLQSAQNRVLEKLGIESLDELDALPDPKAAPAQADALKQFEAKLKRFERERDEALKAKDTMITAMTQAKRQAAIAQAMNAGGFHDAETAEMLLSARVEQQDDEFLFKTKDGRFIPLADGAKLIATEKPYLVKAPQGTGSGFRDAGGTKAAKTMTQAALEALRPAERAKAFADGYTISET